MTPDHKQDLQFVQRVLGGQDEAASDLRTRYHAKLAGILRARGASAIEAEDLLADLWSDCFGATDSGSPLLLKYHGRCALDSWLITVVTNRLIDLKRRQAFRSELAPLESTTIPTDGFDLVPGTPTRCVEAPLLDLLRGAIAKAFSSCDKEGLLMLRLVHIYRVTQREIGRMWGWHESKVSRALDCAREKIRRNILSEIKRTDRWLKVEWDDFTDLCRCASEVFPSGQPMNNLQDREVHQSKKKG
jgi:RNA polymerase sigma factor (sigma-70 family)